MFKDKLIQHIRNDYKELGNLKIKIDDIELEETLYNLLTPYLAHKNTLDEYNRLITFFTKEGSKQQKLLPLYIGLSNYYRTFDNIQSSYEDQDLEISEIERELNLLKGLIPKKFKYLNKYWKFNDISIDVEKNNRIHLSMESIERFPNIIAPKIQDVAANFKTEIKDYVIFKKQIEIAQKSIDEFLKDNNRFLKLKKIKEKSNSNIGVQEILQLTRELNNEPSTGILLFTNKTKYKKLIEDTFIDGKPISELFSIAEIKIGLDNEIRIVNKSSCSTHPIIFYCSIEYYTGWEEIINSIGIGYLNTIVLDDFDVIIKREKRTDYIYFKDFANTISAAQKENRLKDVYFLMNDINFLDHITLTNFGLDSYPWLLNHIERSSLFDIVTHSGANHQVLQIIDELGSLFWTRFKPIIGHLSDLIKEEYRIEQKARYLTILNDGYKLLYRSTTFQNKIDFIDSFGSLIEKVKCEANLLSSPSFKKKFERLKSLKDSEILFNVKLYALVKAIKSRSIDGRIAVVSKNTNTDDIDSAKIVLKSCLSNSIDFFDQESIDFELLKKYQGVFILNYYGKIAKSIFLHTYCPNQFLILNNQQESGYYVNCFNNYTPIIKELSDFDNKLLLLNLEDQDYLIDRNKIDFHLNDYFTTEPIFEEQNSDGENESCEINSEIDEQDFSFIIEQLIYKERLESSDIIENRNINRENLILFFDDDFIKVPGNKYFHVLVNESINGEIEEIKKKATDLVVGDKLFIMQGFNNDFNELLTHLKDQYHDLNYHFDMADSWRSDLQNKYEELGGYISRLNEYLNDNGIQVTNPTVERWVSGLTIVPESLEQLIDLFSIEKNSCSYNYSKTKIIDSTMWLSKFRTSLHKEIFQYHIYKRFNMTHQISQLKLRSLIEKLDKIVFIKEVLLIN